MDSLRYSIGLRATANVADPRVQSRGLPDVRGVAGQHLDRHLPEHLPQCVQRQAFHSFLQNLPSKAIHQSTSAFGAEERRAANEAQDMVGEARSRG